VVPANRVQKVQEVQEVQEPEATGSVTGSDLRKNATPNRPRQAALRAHIGNRYLLTPL
jgi:hypothetical protein